jgi:hypothetical protein
MSKKKTTKYRWKRNSLKGVNAEIVAKTVQNLIKIRGEIKPAELVDFARNKKCPIHRCFEWDNSIAAEKYREEQARYILRQIVIVQECEGKEPFEIRAFVSVDIDKDNVYTTMKRAISEPELYKQILRQAYEDLKAWKEKYDNLREFKKIYKAIREIKTR